MTLYKNFQNLPIDHAAIGLAPDTDGVTYFCTPKGAKVLGWAGVDGIHYCTVRGFGDLIFAVSPMNLAGNCVHPIARSFEDLLCLLLACGSMDAIEQAHDFEEHFFDAFCEQNPPTPKQQAIFDTLRDRLGVTPMEQPYAYVRELQQSFDYSRIPYPPEYYDIDMNPNAKPELPAWKVTFDGGFMPRRGYAGKELPLEKTFIWGEEVWRIPAAYVCSKGLVVDFCTDVAPEALDAFIRKWDLLHEDKHPYTEAEQEQIANEHPLQIGIRPCLTLNGKTLTDYSGTSTCWIAPACLDDGTRNDPETKAVLEHYGLDPNRCWSFHRFSFPWATARKPAIKTLALYLEREPVNIPGIQFFTPEIGESIRFTHPITGAEHTLTVLEAEPGEMSYFRDEQMEFPTHYTAMTYSLSPDISGLSHMVQDCERSDQPRRKSAENPYAYAPTAVCDTAVVGIIGGADGPTALISGAPKNHHAACSALHFNPTQDITWRITFREKLLPDLDISLLGV